MGHNSTHIETSSGQALVSIYKHIQTEENKQSNKPKNFKNEKSPNCHFERSREISKNQNQNPTSPNTDNLKVTNNKNYNEPL